MSEVVVRSTKTEGFEPFLEMHDFEVQSLGEGVYKVTREGELPVFLRIGDGQIYFEVDLGNVSSVASEALYAKLLELNTQILPVSVGLDTTNPDDPRLVLVERRETSDLCDQELLCVFDALELAADRTSELLSNVMQAA
jgi:uncharacterized protein YjfI (DUF2170 family)